MTQKPRKSAGATLTNMDIMAENAMRAEFERLMRRPWRTMLIIIDEGEQVMDHAVWPSTQSVTVGMMHQFTDKLLSEHE